MSEEIEKSSSVVVDPSETKSKVGEDYDLEDSEVIDAVDDATSSAKAIQRHPLEHSWTFWFDSSTAKSQQTTWGSSMRTIYTFSSIEEFWSLYNNIHHPSKLTMKTDLYCFKSNIVPKWEDPICANGGTWTMSFPKEKTDTAWLYTLLAMIGEQFNHGDEICGAVVNVRAKMKISLWTKNALNESAQVSIAKQWKEFIDYNDPQIGFIFHEDAMEQDKETAMKQDKKTAMKQVKKTARSRYNV